MNKPIYLVLSENGPIQNVNRDQSAVKRDLEVNNINLAEAEVQLVASQKYGKTPIRTEKEDNPFRDFNKKYYFEDKKIAIATAEDKARINPGKPYYILETIGVIRSEVKEPEFLPLSDAA